MSVCESLPVNVKLLKKQLIHVGSCSMTSFVASHQGSKKDRKKAAETSDLMNGLADMLSDIVVGLEDHGRVIPVRHGK